MAKIFGSINKNDKTNEKQPDMKGFAKIGGFKGDNADERNREAAEWLKNTAQEFASKGEVYINIAMWKRIDKDTQKPYFSVCMEDNAWKNQTSQSQGESLAPPVAEDPFDDGFNL